MELESPGGSRELGALSGARRWRSRVVASALALGVPTIALAAGARSNGCVWLVVLAVMLLLTVIKVVVEVVSLRRFGIRPGPLGTALVGFDFVLVVAFLVVAGVLAPRISPGAAGSGPVVTGRPAELVLWVLVGFGFFAIATLLETAALGVLLQRDWSRPPGLAEVPLRARMLTAVLGNLGFLVVGLLMGTGSCLRGIQ